MAQSGLKYDRYIPKPVKAALGSLVGVIFVLQMIPEAWQLAIRTYLESPTGEQASMIVACITIGAVIYWMTDRRTKACELQHRDCEANLKHLAVAFMVFLADNDKKAAMDEVKRIFGGDD